MRRTNSISIVMMSLLLACAPAETISVRVIDGDTVDAGLDANIRLTLDDGSGFDTPETFRSGCAAEADLGAKATVRLKRLLRDARTTDLNLGGRSCGFGRYCGALRVDGANVGETLIREGLAKRSKNYDWCNAI
ncbi:thermonuclease family protein [Shimia sp. MMG029]|uniref:thermonuclease family protein n=1 Tax=Shimia sp. MMG029 TaxID=3021978 RepID=UPI0022FEF3DA|nr:thermonuclease family protein [Shimia sp. MMG029]MDA5556046.1 thermonuclease family protein [Shimia sp. MMG029]